MQHQQKWAPGDVPSMAELLKLLHFNADEGLIWLNDQRMVLLHAEDIGVLRQELIESLGADTARGLLSRMGYSSGARDAKLAMSLRKTESRFLHDALLTGGQIHALEGVTAVEVIRAEVGIEAGQLSSEFLWNNSFEAQLHLSSYGTGTATACWLLESYSSGFLSTCMGKRILVREVACCARGDHHCRAIARPLEQWAPEQAEGIRFYEVPAGSPAGKPAGARTTGSDATSHHKTTSSGIPGRHSVASNHSIVGASSAFNAVLHKVNRVAPTNATVLFLGESGVGKSSVARELHRISKRKDRPFIEMNCAAIPDTLMEWSSLASSAAPIRSHREPGPQV
jgi:predicted hydrocarbon binding protein